MTPERFEEIRNIINDHSFVCDERGALAIELFDECDSLRSRLADLEAKNQWIPLRENYPPPRNKILLFALECLDESQDPPVKMWGYEADTFDNLYCPEEVTHYKFIEGPEEG